eukprot:TRINITY_DN7096_c1_g1_i3.p1 TRINITY_DN7096_c1_g1~~TRINITY_DN7096_c1_g1_i3.p1  ORF type:complete len:297 (+),score=83.76 TRINITY_DN7096_c1_g1_i3:97-987(+)
MYSHQPQHFVHQPAAWETKLNLLRHEKQELQMRLMELQDRAQDAEILSQENAHLRQQLSALDSERNHLQAMLQQAQQQLNRPQPSSLNDQDTAALTTYSRQIQALQAEVAQVLAENERLERENKTLRAHQDDDKDFEDLEAITEELIADNKTLKARLRDKDEQVTSIQKQLNEAEDQLVTLRAEHRHLSSADRVDRQELSTLRENNNRLARQVVELQESLKREKENHSYEKQAREASSVPDPMVSRTAEHYEKILQDQARQHQVCTLHCCFEHDNTMGSVCICSASKFGCATAAAT